MEYVWDKMFTEANDKLFGEVAESMITSLPGVHSSSEVCHQLRS